MIGPFKVNRANLQRVREQVTDFLNTISTAVNSKVDEAPSDGVQYGRQNEAWTPIAGGGGGGIPEAPNDGQDYVRRSLTWQVASYFSGAWGDLTGVPATFTPSAHTHAAADVVSGTFATARIPGLATSKITSGTFADARISQSSVTQHQAALSIGYGQLTGAPNLSVYATKAGNETITGTWGFNNSISVTGNVNCTGDLIGGFIETTFGAELGGTLYVPASGDVGVNQTTPLADLHVGDSDGSNHGIIVESDGVSESFVEFRRAATNVDAYLKVDTLEDMVVGYDQSGLGRNFRIANNTGNVFECAANGEVTVNDLSGTGVRPVGVNANGVLQAAAASYGKYSLEDTQVGTSVANTTVTLEWDSSTGFIESGTEVTRGASGIISLGLAGNYEVICSVRTINNNRTELIIQLQSDLTGVMADMALEVASDYVSRDADQNTGGTTLHTIINVTDGTDIRVQVSGDCDGTSTLFQNGTNLIVRYLGP